MEKNRPYDYPKPGISEDLYEAPVDTRPHSRDPKPVNKNARRIEYRLAMQRDSATPDATLMKNKARWLLTATRWAQETAANDLPELETTAIKFARSLIAEIGDATLRSGKYCHPVYFLDWETHWESECYDTFTLDSEGHWHRDRHFCHRFCFEDCVGDVDLVSEALDFLEAVAHHEYAALCLASIFYDDPHLASNVYRDGDSEAAETYGLEEFNEDVRIEFDEDVHEEW